MKEQLVNVNCVSPGATATPLNTQYRADPEILALFARNTPTGRDYIPPQDLAGTALFLAYPGSKPPLEADWAIVAEAEDFELALDTDPQLLEVLDVLEAWDGS